MSETLRVTGLFADEEACTRGIVAVREAGLSKSWPSPPAAGRWRAARRSGATLVLPRWPPPSRRNPPTMAVLFRRTISRSHRFSRFLVTAFPDLLPTANPKRDPSSELGRYSNRTHRPETLHPSA